MKRDDREAGSDPMSTLWKNLDCESPKKHAEREDALRIFFEWRGYLFVIVTAGVMILWITFLLWLLIRIFFF
jgi:hypothetical protein